METHDSYLWATKENKTIFFRSFNSKNKEERLSLLEKYSELRKECDTIFFGDISDFNPKTNNGNTTSNNYDRQI